MLWAKKVWLCVFYHQGGWKRGCIWWCPVCRVLWMRVQQGILGSDRRRWGAALRHSCSAEPAARAGTDACPRSGSTHTDHHNLKITASGYTYFRFRAKCHYHNVLVLCEPDNNLFLRGCIRYLEWVSSVQKLFENRTWIIKTTVWENFQLTHVNSFLTQKHVEKIFILKLMFNNIDNVQRTAIYYM